MPCERLFYDKPYLRRFAAKVVDTGTSPDGPWVKLDRTAFYATSGGQPNDTGSIGASIVKDVVEQGEDIIHVVDRLPDPGASEVACEIDWERRFDFMQQHAGQHVMSSAFEKVLDADTVGFHLTENSLTVDLNVPSLDEDKIDEVETLANSVVYRNVPIRSVWPNEAELQAMPLRKPPTRSEGIRVIVVDDFDWSPCGGTHTATTGEIGMIKILGWEKVRAGVRVTLVCGGRALMDYRSKNRAVKAISAALSVPAGSVDAAVARLAEQASTQHKRIETLSKQLIEFEAQTLVSTGDQVIARTYPVRNAAELRALASMVVASPGRVVVLGASAPSVQVLVARSDDLTVDARELIEAAKSVLGGRGGGNPKMAQAGGADGALVSAAVEAVVATAAMMLRK